MAVAGFSAKAEQLRRAMSRKRSREEMEKLREDFMTHAAQQGIDEQAITTIYVRHCADLRVRFGKLREITSVQERRPHGDVSR